MLNMHLNLIRFLGKWMVAPTLQNELHHNPHIYMHTHTHTGAHHNSIFRNEWNERKLLRMKCRRILLKFNENVDGCASYSGATNDLCFRRLQKILKAFRQHPFAFQLYLQLDDVFRRSTQRCAEREFVQ